MPSREAVLSVVLRRGEGDCLAAAALAAEGVLVLGGACEEVSESSDLLVQSPGCKTGVCGRDDLAPRWSGSQLDSDRLEPVAVHFLIDAFPQLPQATSPLRRQHIEGVDSRGGNPRLSGTEVETVLLPARAATWMEEVRGGFCAPPDPLGLPAAPNWRNERARHGAKDFLGVKRRGSGRHGATARPGRGWVKRKNSRWARYEAEREVAIKERARR
jgi:hypothetical protein